MRPLVEKSADHIVTEPQETFFDRYEHLRITMLNEIPEPNPIVSIENHIISTAGNLTMLSGNSKAGKSAFCSVIIAGAIRGHKYYYDGFEPLYIDSNEEKKAVIHIDTEQAKHNHYQNLKNAVLKRSDLEELPEYFYSYNIREMEIKERQKFTEKLFFEAADTDTYRSFLKRNAMSYAVQGSEEFGEFIKRQTQVYLEQFEKLGLEAD